MSVKQTLHIAVQGCAHGELHKIYQSLTTLPNKTDLLLVLGDFQSLRTTDDFPSISVPSKYVRLGDFPDYYSGRRKAPVLTIFIGGNHENFAQLVDLPHGGWVAPNIYYMGYSGVVWYRGVRIGGLSGIYKHWDVLAPPRPRSAVMAEGHWNELVRSLYHVRVSDVLPLLLLDKDTDMPIMMSHDWPRGIEHYGNCSELLRCKPHFATDIQKRELGSPFNWTVLQRLRPRWWLSAHLHVKYKATVYHNERKNNDEIALDLSDDENNTADSERHMKSTKAETHFLALDKCKKGRHTHISMIDVECDTTHPSYKSDCLFWDPEFAANVRFICQSKEGQASATQHLETIDLDRLIASAKAHNGNTEQLEWDKFCIPPPTDLFLQQPSSQTSYFEQKVLEILRA